jgi:cytochrome c oxidase assembly protein subunit 15
VANLVAQIGIVVTGGIVRLTGSGLGCPTWPECVDGSIAPTSAQEEPTWHKAIEFGNRLLTFVLAALAIAALVATIVWWRRTRARGETARTPLLLWAAVPLIGTVVQAVLGGITVLTGLSPLAVATHFLVSMAIISGCVVLVVRSRENGDLPREFIVASPVRILVRALVVVAAVVVVLGVVVTGSGPHAGDDDVASRFPFDPRTAAWLHADAVWLFLGLLAGVLIATRLIGRPQPLSRRAGILAVIAYLQYVLGLPAAIVALHMLGACLTWAGSVWVLLGIRRRGTLEPADEFATSLQQR